MASAGWGEADELRPLQPLSRPCAARRSIRLPCAYCVSVCLAVWFWLSTGGTVVQEQRWRPRLHRTFANVVRTSSNDSERRSTPNVVRTVVWSAPHTEPASRNGPPSVALLCVSIGSAQEPHRQVKTRSCTLRQRPVSTAAVKERPVNSQSILCACRTPTYRSRINSD